MCIRDRANIVPSAANARYYANIIEEKAILRRLIQFANNIASRCYEDSEETHELLDSRCV